MLTKDGGVAFYGQGTMECIKLCVGDSMCKSSTLCHL